MKKFPIALQVYSVRGDAEQDFAGTMRRVKDMGYDGVELAGLYGKTAAECKAILDEVGLELVSAHVNLDLQDQDEILKDYASTGMKYIAIPWLPGPKDEAEQAEVIDRIRKAGERCKENGMTLLYHNHDFEFHKFGDRYVLDAYYEEISADVLQTELDTCWVNVGGENPADYVRKYAGRAPIVHVKDFVGVKTENMYGLIGGKEEEAKKSGAFEFRPVGSGVQNFPAILEAAEAAGAKWLVVEQDQPALGKTPLECAEMSIQYLKSIM